jgi:hypothetical protein
MEKRPDHTAGESLAQCTDAHRWCDFLQVFRGLRGSPPAARKGPIVAVQIAGAQSAGEHMADWRRRIRVTAGVLASLELAGGGLLGAHLVSTGGDPLGAAIAHDVGSFLLWTVAATALPGLLLALWGRWPGLALAFAAAAPPVWLYLMASA